MPCRYASTDRRHRRARAPATNATSELAALHRRHPAIRTVVVAPQIASERKKSMMLTATIAVRTARPTATPTPAGPPLGRVAVVAVDQDHDHAEDEHLARTTRARRRAAGTGGSSGRRCRRTARSRRWRSYGWRSSWTAGPTTYSGIDRDEAGDDPGGDQERQLTARAITSSASTSSLMRIAPSWAVKPQPTVADSARPATSGEISRVLK